MNFEELQTVEAQAGTPKLATFGVPFPMKFLRPQLYALAILLCFVTSSVLGRVVSTTGNVPEPWKVALHSPCDMPQGDNQLPFEERELEDKTDTQANPEKALDSHVIIFDFEPAFRFAEKAPYRNRLFRTIHVTRNLNCPSIFILDGALLI